MQDVTWEICAGVTDTEMDLAKVSRGNMNRNVMVRSMLS
jgi:hypothetical protein